MELLIQALRVCMSLSASEGEGRGGGAKTCNGLGEFLETEILPSFPVLLRKRAPPSNLLAPTSIFKALELTSYNHYLFKHTRHENKGNRHQRQNVLFFNLLFFNLFSQLVPHEIYEGQ